MAIKNFILFAMLAFCGCFAQEIFAEENHPLSLIAEIMENSNYCVKGIVGDKIYFHLSYRQSDRKQ